MDPDQSTARKERAQENAKKAHECRLEIENRLWEEGEHELAAKIAACGQPFGLTCLNCGGRHEVKTRCKRKWCPVCVRAIAAKRSAKVLKATAHFEWPLFITLTEKNVDDLEPTHIRHLRRSFGKLRHRKIWKDTVKGGVASIEVTNIGNGWHPHMHALVDCEWLAVKTPKPSWRWTKTRKRQAYEDASNEFAKVWAHCLGHERAFIRAKRASLGSISKEIAKYSVKGSDLVACQDAIGPLIRAIDSTRLVTTFGSVFGMKIEEEKHPLQCEGCGPNAAWMPSDMVGGIVRSFQRETSTRAVFFGA